MARALIDAVARIMGEVAAAEVMPRWRNLGAGDVAEKTGPDDLVTIADQAAELALATRLRDLLPGSLVVGEEAVAADPAVIGRLSEPGSVWVIDPIDGTQAFAAGEPEFTLMVALVEGGAPKLGFVLAPAIGWIVCGGPGQGTFRSTSGAPLQPLAARGGPQPLSGMTGLLGKRNITEARRAELQAKGRHFRALDGVTFAGIDYARLATGEAHFAVYNKTEPWDHLPGLAMLSGLGFVWSKHDGTPYRPGDNTGGLLVAPDAASLSEIRRVLMG